MLNSSGGYTGATRITGGVLKVVPSQTGLFQGEVANGTNAFDTADAIPPASVQLSTPYANSTNTGTTGAYQWTNNTTWGYSGYIDNALTTSATWSFAKNFDDSMLLKIDGNTVINNGTWNQLVVANYVATPGEHLIQVYLGQGGGGVGPNIAGWPNNLGLGIDVLGRSSTNASNYTSLTDPGNGSFLSTGLRRARRFPPRPP